MIIIPAIDIKDGKCVRLAQGKFDHVTKYADNPVDVALRWKEQGAEVIHIVDLDGSVVGKPRNVDIILEIAQTIDVPVQLGGGIRNMETIEFYLGNGVSSVILGTAAVHDKEFVRKAGKKYPGKIILGLDALDGHLGTSGWTEKTEQDPIGLAKNYEHCNMKAIVYTDIKRDGMSTGVNIEATKAMAKAVSIPVIASGGVASMTDIENLMAVDDCEIYGVIIGRALYNGAIALEEAISRSKKK